MNNVKHPENLIPMLPDLVQRMELREHNADDRSGVDRYFSMDYMGSSEFEWGALSRTLKHLRTLTLPNPVKFEAVRDGQPVVAWYVGPESHREVAEYWFKLCVGAADGQYKFDMKEMPRVFDAYGPEFKTEYTPTGRVKKVKNPRRNYGTTIVGWWCVDRGYRDDRYTPRPLETYGCWAIFRQKEYANNWLKGLKDKPAEK
jgi:hypothetical protein